MELREPSKKILVALSVTIAACGGSNEPSSSGTLPDQLEAPAVTGLTSTSDVTQQGAVTVTGSGRDFTVTIGSGAPLGVHSPGMSDLTTLGGRTLTVDLLEGGFNPTLRAILATDAQGPVYVVDLGPDAGIDTDTLFGAGFATYGTPVASVIDDLSGGEGSGYIETDYTPLVFKSDSGPVSLLPGQAGAVTVKGVVYRVAVIGATDVTVHGSSDLGCGPTSSMVFEMLRVDVPPASTTVTRPANLGPISFGCGGI